MKEMDKKLKKKERKKERKEKCQLINVVLGEKPDVD